MSRFIYFETTNKEKVVEVTKQFERYGIHVTDIEPDPTTKGYFAKIKEHTTLVAKNGKLQYIQLEPVLNISTLFYTVFKDEITGSIEKKVEGYIDIDRKLDGTFGFDSYFVVTDLGKSFHELKQLGFKLSARDHCIAEFIEKFLYRTKLADWKHQPQHFEKPLELHRDPHGFFEKNEHINNPVATKYGIPNMIRYVLNCGLFFRASQNRRQNLYWFPGLNAGIPFTSKPKDPMHELVYFIHDVIHHAIPDLVYTGQNSHIARFVYIAYRLMSEAITLVGADMGFSDSLLKSKIGYDTIEGRKIYPLFQSMNVNLEKKGELFNLMRDDMLFCLMGDPSGFQSRNPDPTKLSEFIDKYEIFFKQDFKWTAHNYDDMKSRPETYAKWWATVKHWQFNNKLITIDEFINLLDNGPDKLISDGNIRQACHIIFEKILELYVIPAFNDTNELKPFNIRYDNMFRRYMMGQAYIFFRYEFIDNARYLEPIDRLMRNPKLIDVNQGEIIRRFYEEYLGHLKILSLITEDDFITFKEIYPLFEPMILSYEVSIKENHKAFALRILEGDK